MRVRMLTVTVGVAAVVIPSGAALATPKTHKLPGTYRAKVTSRALHGTLKGTWKLHFQKNGLLVATRNGKNAGKTKFSTKGTRLTLKASPGCPSVGTYTFAFSGDTVKFTRLKDPCRPRRIVFSYRFTAAS